MKKTMIYLDESQHDRLRRLAADRDSSLAHLVREAVNLYLDSQAQRPSARFIGAGEGPEQGDVACRTDEILRELSS